MKFARTTGDQPAAGAELVPDGEHECEIVSVKEWSSREGDRQAVILTLQPRDPRYAAIEKWLDPGNDRDAPLVAQLADVLGLAGDEIDIDQSLVGQAVRITAKNGIRKKDGQATVYVNAFLEPTPVWKQNGAAAAPVKAAPKRTPLQKAKAASAEAGSGDDDVPFLWLLPFVLCAAAGVIA